jgi:membrane fusion protein (multidrug efflux system)
MRIWAFLLAGLVLVAAAAFGFRHYGIDLAAVTGLGQGMAKGEAPQRPGVQRGNRGPSPVETARAVSAQLSDDISAIGTLLADESVAIAPETSGRVAKILFRDGQSVEAGTPLFQFDTDLAQSELAEARARLKLAEANYARNEKLRQSGNVAVSAYEEALSGRDVARVAVETAEVRLAKLTISAPFSGQLGFRNVSEGAYVTAGTPLVQLDKVDRLQVSFSVPELQQAAVAAASAVELTADAVPGERLAASISALNPSIDVNGRALQVRGELHNRDMKLRPGLLVRVTVKGPQRQAVLIPESAIVQRGQGALVYVVADNKVREARVSLGKRLDGQVEVKDGISAGDEVVTAGNSRLSDGGEVEVVRAAAAAE